MRISLRPSSVVMAGILGAACWAQEACRSPAPEPIGRSVETALEQVFPKPRLCLDREAGDRFFREVPPEGIATRGEEGGPALVRIELGDADQFRPDARALAMLATSDEEAAKKYDRIKREMASLLAEHPGSQAASEVKLLLETARQMAEPEGAGKLARGKQTFQSGVLYTR